MFEGAYQFTRSTTVGQTRYAKGDRCPDFQWHIKRWLCWDMKAIEPLREHAKPNSKRSKRGSVSPLPSDLE